MYTYPHAHTTSSISCTAPKNCRTLPGDLICRWMKKLPGSPSNNSKYHLNLPATESDFVELIGSHQEFGRISHSTGCFFSNYQNIRQETFQRKGRVFVVFPAKKAATCLWCDPPCRMQSWKLKALRWC